MNYELRITNYELRVVILSAARNERSRRIPRTFDEVR